MQKSFSKQYMSDNCGCYSQEQLLACSFMNRKEHEIPINSILNSEIPLKDKFWFVINKCDLTTKQKQILSLNCAKIVLQIYENKYPNDKRVAECIEYTEKYINCSCSIEELREKRRAAAAAAAYAAAAAAAAYAADAAAYAAAAAAYAADASISKNLLQMLIDFCSNN